MTARAHVAALGPLGKTALLLIFFPTGKHGIRLHNNPGRPQNKHLCGNLLVLSRTPLSFSRRVTAPETARRGSPRGGKYRGGAGSAHTLY